MGPASVCLRRKRLPPGLAATPAHPLSVGHSSVSGGPETSRGGKTRNHRLVPGRDCAQDARNFSNLNCSSSARVREMACRRDSPCNRLNPPVSRPVITSCFSTSRHFRPAGVWGVNDRQRESCRIAWKARRKAFPTKAYRSWCHTTWRVT